jgi:Cu/Ag efflux protein CusF
MKKSALVVFGLLALVFFLTNVAIAEQAGKMRTATGKVTSIDPGGKAITISEKVGKEVMDVGTVVDKDTVIKVKGKKAGLDDIKVGDTITIRYLESNNLYAKEILKK